MHDVDEGREDGRNQARGSEGLAGPGAVDERGDRRHGDEGLHEALVYARREENIFSLPSGRPLEKKFVLYKKKKW